MLLFDEKRKNTLTCKKEIACFFSSIGCHHSFFACLSTNHQERREEEEKNASKERSNIHRIMMIRKRNQPTK